MYLLAAVVLILAVAAITSGVVVCYNSYQNLQQHMTTCVPSTPQPIMPIVTKSGEIINSPDELEEHLQMLNVKLQEKVSALTANKSKASSTEEKIQRLDMTKNEINKFYLRLKNEISRTENECQELQEQINDYIRRREEVKNETPEQYHDVDGYTKEQPKRMDETELTYEEIQKWIHEFKNKYNLSSVCLENHDNENEKSDLYSSYKFDEQSKSNYKSFLKVCNSINCDYKTLRSSSIDTVCQKKDSKTNNAAEIST